MLLRTAASNSAQADLKTEALKVGRDASSSPAVICYRDCGNSDCGHSLAFLILQHEQKQIPRSATNNRLFEPEAF